jgi:hypothetical protein
MGHVQYYCINKRCHKDRQTCTRKRGNKKTPYGPPIGSVETAYALLHMHALICRMSTLIEPSLASVSAPLRIVPSAVNSPRPTCVRSQGNGFSAVVLLPISPPSMPPSTLEKHHREALVDQSTRVVRAKAFEAYQECHRY